MNQRQSAMTVGRDVMDAIEPTKMEKYEADANNRNIGLFIHAIVYREWADAMPTPACTRH